jgi:hypothetical protein
LRKISRTVIKESIIQVVEPDSVITEVQGSGRPFAFVFAVEKVFLEFFFGNPFRTFFNRRLTDGQHVYMLAGSVRSFHLTEASEPSENTSRVFLLSDEL